MVDALVPLAEMFQYVSTLRGMTKGRASYTMQLAKFDVVPQHIQNELASKEQEVAAWFVFFLASQQPGAQCFCSLHSLKCNITLLFFNYKFHVSVLDISVTNSDSQTLCFCLQICECTINQNFQRKERKIWFCSMNLFKEQISLFRFCLFHWKCFLKKYLWKNIFFKKKIKIRKIFFLNP